MTNAERLAAHINEHGAQNILIHTIPKSQFWLVAEKIGRDLWVITLMNPLKNVKYQVGQVTDRDHLRLWLELTKLEIEVKAEGLKVARQLRRAHAYFLADTTRSNYQHLLARHVHGKPRTRKRSR